MKRGSGRRVISFDEFFSKGTDHKRSEAAQRPKHRAAHRKQTEKKNHLRGRVFRFVGVLAVFALLMGITFAGDLRSLCTGAVHSSQIVGLFGSAKNEQSGSRQVILCQKPAFPGCKSGNAYKETTQQIASVVRPSVVGIVQYQKGALQESGEGSGIIMTADGYIITNNHVVDGASRLVVVLQSGKKLEASLVGRDARMDLAVVKVEAKGLATATFGDSSQCEVGEQVVAIGNPSGLKLAGSVTQGIISALNRDVDVGNGPMSLIQTDAAINPGNSGGALVNMYGQVVGINSAKIAQQGYEGIGFSIPINTAKPVVDSLIRYGYVKGRVKFGFSCRAIDQITARLNDIPMGIYIDAVEKNGPAANSGLETGDIVTRVDNASVTTTEELIVQRDKHKPGDTLTLTVTRVRGAKQLTLTVTLAEDRGDQAVSAGSNW